MRERAREPLGEEDRPKPGQEKGLEGSMDMQGREEKKLLIFST
jgi:hypothetical protein